MSSFAELELNVIRWSEQRRIIPNSTPVAQWKKAMEEMDELGRGLEAGDMVESVDGIGDVTVCLLNICALLDVNFTDCLAHAFSEIKDRKGTMNAEGIFVKEAK